MGIRYAVVGATGNVGREMLQILAERDVPANDVTALASSRSVGAEVSYGEDDVLEVGELAGFDFGATDIVLSSPGARVSAEHSPRAAAAGAVVIDNTGKWRDEAGLGLHLKSKGVSRVLLTAPGKGDIKNIVHGINNDWITREDRILSAASCTTNAITPVLKAIYDEYGVEDGHVETVHSYTNDQNLIDNYHKGSRRGRSAPLNMVITETGAAKAVAKALPELKGKLSGNAIRVPTPNVSMAILNLNLEKDVTVEGVNEYLRDMALHSELHKQIDFTNSQEVVSTDFVGSRHAGVVDAEATICNDNRVILYVWYDNEFGYSCQVVRILEDMAHVNPPAFPA